MFCICLFDVKLSEGDIKKIDTLGYVSELYVKMYLLLVRFLVLTDTLKNSDRIFGQMYFCLLEYFVGRIA